MLSRERSKASGIKEIAQALGVSIGTVDRALHNRPGINAKTHKRVLEMAGRLGYRANIAARFLKLNRHLHISVHLPLHIAAFFDMLRAGVREAARPFQSTIDLQFHRYHDLYEGDVALFEDALRRGVDGIIIAPGNPRLLRSCLEQASARGVPVVCVATDAPGMSRLTSVSADPFTGGAMAAELLTRCSRRPGPVLVMTGALSTADHTEKLRGFATQLSSMQSALTIMPVVETHDDAAEAADKMRGLLRRHKDLSAVYVSTANSLPVVKALKASGRLPEITVVTTDLFPELESLLREGSILGTIYQRPQTQGRIAFDLLYRFIAEGVNPPVRQLLPPHIILQSNLDLFVDIQRQYGAVDGDIPKAARKTAPAMKKRVR